MTTTRELTGAPAAAAPSRREAQGGAGGFDAAGGRVALSWFLGMASCCARARLVRQQTTRRACANARTPTTTHLAIAHSCLPLREEGGCGYGEWRWARTPVICGRGMVAWECRGGSPADRRWITGGSPVDHHEFSMEFMNQRGFSVNHVDKHKPSANQHEPR